MIFFNEKFSASSKDELLREIAAIVNEEVYNDLIHREGEYSTGLENGFAIPHCRTKHVSEPHIIFGELKNQIEDYDTLDDSKVDTIISFIVPENVEGNETHLRLLALVMRKLCNEDVQKAFKLAKTIDDKKRILEME